MIIVAIGESERSYEDASPHWINEQINRRRNDNFPVCVRVTIKKGAIDMILSTPCCSGGSGGRAPRPQEQEIFELWDKRHMNNDDFTGGNLVAFLKQIKDLA